MLNFECLLFEVVGCDLVVVCDLMEVLKDSCNYRLLVEMLSFICDSFDVGVVVEVEMLEEVV